MTTHAHDREAIARAVRLAREAAVASGATVLDKLQEQGTHSIDEWDLALRSASQVAALDLSHAHRIEWSSLPLDRARELRAIAVTISDEPYLRVCMADPWDDDRAQRLASELGRWPRFAATTGRFLTRYLEGERHDPAMPSEASRSAVDCVDDALRQALELGASDVHIECDRDGLKVKLRHDGVMLTLATLSGVQRADEVISRVKVLAQLDITERRTPQDGRFRWMHEDRAVDLRVSIMPSIHGEDAVLRLLDRAQLRATAPSISLDALGFRDVEARTLRGLARLPHGMLLITGPTGSGKTTTVYAALSEFNTGLEKIITIEDPVEYELPGVLQIPVNERKGLTFAKGLRSILRHDPDRILVGEIRDSETAAIAVQSALTGHQVLTTVHANSIYDVIGRFRHFGMDMFGFASSLNGVVVQRLLRRLCPDCRGWRRPFSGELRWLSRWGAEPLEVPMSTGCPVCRSTGYLGRTVIAEVHTIDDGLRDLVTSDAQVSALRHHVDEGPVVSLARQAAMLVASGVTTLDEVERIVGPL